MISSSRLTSGTSWRPLGAPRGLIVIPVHSLVSRLGPRLHYRESGISAARGRSCCALRRRGTTTITRNQLDGLSDHPRTKEPQIWCDSARTREAGHGSHSVQSTCVNHTLARPAVQMWCTQAPSTHRSWAARGPAAWGSPGRIHGSDALRMRVLGTHRTPPTGGLRRRRARRPAVPSLAGCG